ncbi:MAG: hypothetical protein CMLOHMNK_01910 [Steroidobacteraceae bacterium]|nr:hypothetical protein [Steroidobacteraceae bacterium]
MRSLLAAFRSPSLPVRECALLAAALLVGITIVPIAVYFSGHEVFGAYTGGGLFRFWGDFFVALFRGNLPWWILALGPYALLMFIRATRVAWRQSARV